MKVKQFFTTPNAKAPRSPWPSANRPKMLNMHIEALKFLMFNPQILRNKLNPTGSMARLRIECYFLSKSWQFVACKIKMFLTWLFSRCEGYNGRHTSKEIIGVTSFLVTRAGQDIVPFHLARIGTSNVIIRFSYFFRMKSTLFENQRPFAKAKGKWLRRHLFWYVRIWITN